MASGYDLSNRNPFRLIQGRLGTYNKTQYEPGSDKVGVDGVHEQDIRLAAHGGNRQQERMIKDKRRSLEHALWNSYQGADVIFEKFELKKPARALINPNRLKQDYDDKIISIGHEYNIQCGDVFEWVGTNTHWLVYLQDLTELAYFRGDIRKCSYQISWEDEDGKHTTYAAVRGPVETKINYIQKHGISVDIPNHSLSILMPLTEASLKYFKRYSKFYLQNEKVAAEDKICWRVEGIDWISIPGILEIIAVEYYANETEDDIEEGIVGGLIVEEENPNSTLIENIIQGDTFIKPKKEYVYKLKGDIPGSWFIDKKYPVSMTIDADNSKIVSVRWEQSYSGNFELSYGNLTKTIIVESLF